MAALIITGTVAEKRCSKCKRVLPAAMFNKANWLPSGLRSDCKDCCKAFKARWWAAQPKGPHAVRAKELKALATQGLRRCKACGAVKPLTEQEFALAKGCWNSDCRECVRARVKRWREQNRDRAHANAVAGCALRHASKRQRTPPWLSRADRAKILSIYAECRRVSQATGIKHHVDHIVPLVGKYVSGLHVPGNLQILSGSENCKKSNKWIS